MESIGVRELRQHASRWLARVAAGESFTVTDRGRPVAVLAPAPADPWRRLLDAGALLPAGSDLRAFVPGPPVSGRPLSELVAADRDDER